MPKIRGIHPDFWTDEAVVELSPLARLLFVGLWNFACDNGHVEDKPKQLKMRILPADDCDVSSLLDELVGQGLVTRAGGVVTVVNLARRQRIDRRYFTTCSLVACEKPDVDTTGKAPKPVPNPASPQREPVERPSSAPRVPAVAPSRPRVDGDGDGDGDKRTPSSADADGVFDAWWKHYPRKVDKGHARKAFAKALKIATVDDLTAGAIALAESTKGVEPRFIPHAATWLNGERWTDAAPVEPESRLDPSWNVTIDGPPDHLLPPEFRTGAS